MKLYFSPGACSMAPHIVMNELGIAFETEKVDLRAKTTANGTNYLTVNPRGQVPTLQLDSKENLNECVAIMQYLADQKPEANLMPKWNTLERYRAVEWLNYIATEIHKGYTPFFTAQNLITDEAARTEFLANNKKALLTKLEWVDAQLAGKDFLLGKQMTVCDAYLFTCHSWGQYIALDTSHLKNLTAFSARMYQRPAVQKTMLAEGLLK